MNILVFKTDLHSPERIHNAKPVIQNIGGISRWTVDMHDCDNVLRIESIGLSARAVETILADAGYYCEELED